MMKLLVTGGAGFIGSNFVRYMLEKYPDCRIVNLDKLTYAGNLENLSGLENDSRHEFVQGDICDADAVSTLLQNGVDAVINFAAESHVDRSILRSQEFIRTNVVGTLNLLESCRKTRTARFIQISTDEVYGSLGSSGLFTELSPIAPNSPYAASKASADLLVRSYCHTHDFPGIITRCSNNYGPYQFPEKLIPLLISNALAGRPLPIYGDGMNVRDWIHVRDHCSAVDVVLQKGKNGEVYNVGASQEFPNIYVASRILELLNQDVSLLTYVEDRPGHDRRYAIDSSKLESELGWRAHTLFKDGLRETIEWYRGNSGWIDHVQTGAYLTYYDRMYRQRSKTLSQR
jgi:dTDP-glucose 4,6-dehydratase